MKYYAVKISKDNKEFLEIVDCASEKEARKILACKYMNIVLSCQTSLAVVKKAEFDKMCVC